MLVLRNAGWCESILGRFVSRASSELDIQKAETVGTRTYSKMKTSHAKAFSEANPNVHFLSPSMPGYRERRATRGEAGQELIPLGIAVPNNAKQVCDIVLWALKAGVEFAVRSGGNDFYGRNVIQDGLVIDMRDMNAVEISDDKRTATIGGGVIGNQLLEKFEEENIMAPLGNLGLIGYIGWATLGGYGPFTNMFGMGYEGIIGAQIVNANGELVRATDEELEAIRGMGGNIGIITSLTFKTYPARQVRDLLGTQNPQLLRRR